MVNTSFLAGVTAVPMIVCILIGILTLIAYWRIFTKAGVAGWKAIIPYYSGYVMFKIAWKTSVFWWNLLVSVLLACVITAVMTVGSTGAYTVMGVPVILGFLLASVLGIINFMISIMYNIKLSKAFGHGGGFAVGLIFLNVIFILILGLGDSVYLGPQTE